MKISVIIPSVRDTSLNEKCLKRQTFKDFEVIIQRPTRKLPKGNFYQLNHDYNQAIKKAKGDLIVSYQDMIEIRPDTLERLFYHFTTLPKAIVGAVGDQYSTLDPPIKVWQDPRRTLQYGTFYQCMPDDIEWTLCSVSKKALYDVGGFEEEFDKGAAIGEKELMHRLDKAGYIPYLDQSIEYRAIKHPRLTKDWDKYYKIASELYAKLLPEIHQGLRLKLNYLTL